MQDKTWTFSSHIAPTQWNSTSLESSSSLVMPNLNFFQTRSPDTTFRELIWLNPSTKSVKRNYLHIAIVKAPKRTRLGATATVLMNTIAILHILFFKYVSCKFASVSYFANMIFLLGRNQNTISSGFKAPPSSVSLLDGDIYIYVYIYTHIFSSFVLGISKPFKQHCGRCARNSPVTRLVDSSNRGASSDRVQRPLTLVLVLARA